MDNKNGKNHDFPMDLAIKMANSQAGQQLFSHLQQQNGAALQQAMAAASAGDMAAAQMALSQLLADPDTVKLLNQLKE